ncbi:MAG: class I SAM-dependent RNA methyltransferase [Oscillospiraceae bacterium]|nr:class I SAM-dependent RNA methyltransferase [Oscillospiraceae bacterium]
MKLKLSCPCHFGLESVLNFEIKKIGGENISVTDGKITFEGDENILARANICLAGAERVLVELASFKATTFEELFQGVKKIPLEDFVGVNDVFPVKGHCLNSQLHSVPDCQKIIKKACVERLKAKYNTSWFEETGATYQLQFSIFKDVATIYLDSTGIGLHKRGYRRNSNDAPIKETLAAGIVDLARVRGDSIVVDPMCGSGTFLIESAYKALNIAPGLRRKFVAESWGAISPDVWKNQREYALSQINKQGNFKAYGFDIDGAAVALSEANAKKAGVASKIEVDMRDVRKLKREKGTIALCNPTYGERMLEVKEAEKLYGVLGEKLCPDRESPAYIISPHEDFEQFFGKKADKKRKLYNGMIKCNLYMYFK